MSHQDAYQQLASVFTSRGNQVLEIEIIPSSLGSFLQDGNAVGTSKKTLVAAYIVARQLFSNLQPGDFSHPAITEIMLLFDCEHLTACNWRKLRIKAATAASDSQDLLQAELTLLTSYQCSPLHRHTKSPTLWHHRLWVLRQMQRRLPSQEGLDCLNSELEVVLRAGELHPRNYYAFSHMRQLSALLDTHWDPSTIDRVVDWCLANPRDISGWSFAVYILDTSTRPSQVQALEKVIRFALGVRWEGESLWTFIAQAARQFGLEASLEKMMIPEGHSSPMPDSWTRWLELARSHWAHG
ncbi:unnamed protein product [Penicillium salamii]|uniref:Protein prenyltransferase n=1 Tax=Penicillium salamii TaxID=1612424 RepID=A0A9W4NPL9_9EURO|nr:unnamed protein product [Penicillium salamii]CAG8103649.1 unnamed protein product [Penicillium salamii]CAG8137870.1 unnamed protein product [Penicillium salamii]CAG8144597.1 unnamed protein product [Penicillium salamii]CAG8179736.1 unnamed protein product [Penicillium salamii]